MLTLGIRSCTVLQYILMSLYKNNLDRITILVKINKHINTKFRERVAQCDSEVCVCWQLGSTIPTLLLGNVPSK